MTFSLVGRDGATGALGIAVTSSSPAVAARCAHVRAGAGAAASQNVTDPRLGRRLLDLLEADPVAGSAPERRVAFPLKLLLAAGLAPQLFAFASRGGADGPVGFSPAAGGGVCGAREAGALPHRDAERMVNRFTNRHTAELQEDHIA